MGCDTIAAAVAGTSTARLPPLWTDVTWEAQALAQQRLRTWVAQRPPHGLLGLADPGRPTHGRRAVGGARQDAGTLGTVAHGPGVVRAPEVAEEPTHAAPVHGPRTAPLSLPEAGATAPARRATGHVPPAGAVQTKPALALALLEQAQAWGVPVAWGVAAASDGAPPPSCRASRPARAPMWWASAAPGGYACEKKGVRPRACPPRARRAVASRRRAPRRGRRPRLSLRPCWRRAGSPAPGVSTPPSAAVHRSWRCGGTGPPVALHAPRAIPASAQGRRAGYSASAPCRAPVAPASGTSGLCRRTPRGVDWSSGPTAAGPWSSSPRPPRARGAWTTRRAAAGMAGIGTSPWSCGPTVVWRASAGRPPTRRALPPAGERPSFPAVPRQGVLWLFQDVVLWLIATNHMAHFRPMRN